MLRKPVLTYLLLPLIAIGLPLSSASALTPNDTFYGQQWYLKQIGAEQAWDRTTGSSDVTVAVIDTSMDIDHEDLKDVIWTNTREVFGNGVDDDHNGFIDDIHGWNFVRSSNEVRPIHLDDATDHGYVHATLVASLIAAKGNNSTGIAGVAWGVRIMPVVALDSTGDGSTSAVAQAIGYAVDNGAQIINVSLEGYEDAPDVDAALRYAKEHNVLTVAASGNADTENGFDLDTLPVYPVCLSKMPEYAVLGVGSTNRQDSHAGYANYGSCVQVSAPGEDIFGARAQISNASTTQRVAGYEGGYSGTSMAAPLVAGTAALIKSIRPDWGWAEIKDRIMMSADPVDHLQDKSYRNKIGRGRLNTAAAVLSTPANPNPSVTTAFIKAATMEVSGSVPGTPTKILIRQGTQAIVTLAPFGSKDTRGARATLVDLDGDGTSEIVVTPASGREGLWIAYNANGTERARGTVATNLKEGLLVAGTGDKGFVVADPSGGRAWGVDAAGKASGFTPYGATYRAGLDLVSVPGGVAFSPRGGGGHLMVTDRSGKRLVSYFPFGKTARGRWSVARIEADTTHGTRLLLSGPTGTKAIMLTELGADRWSDLPTAELSRLRLLGSSGRSSTVPGEILLDSSALKSF